MSSNTRRQLENWLGTIEVKGSVLDAGGVHMPIQGRTKTWEVTDYKILDCREDIFGHHTDYVEDLNFPIYRLPSFDNVFLIFEDGTIIN